MFDHAHSFTVSGGTFTNNSTTVTISPNNLMEKLLEKSMPEAAFNSSTRDPPPRCHPGTRLSILGRCVNFIVTCSNVKKIRWVVGAAGVGKSAIMQCVAESPLVPVELRASIFFVINRCNDGTKAIITLAYQLAAKSETYRRFIEYELTRDPSLLYSSMSEQFNKLIVGAFIDHPQLSSVGRVLIFIDGLDECDKSRIQVELLHLISDFCITYPSSPVVWIIAGRPGVHITSFFSQASIKAVFEQEEILVDSDEAREDAEKFLRDELAKVQQEFSLSPGLLWPSESDFWKLANASAGLFVYAQTAMNYIGDSDFGNPTSRLNDVLKVIDAHPLPNVPQEQHPMLLLDTLYAQILSKVPDRIMVNTRKILLGLAFGGFPRNTSFIVLCNWFGMTGDDAYAALHHLSAVLKVPGRAEAHVKELQAFHKSFIDYLLARSEILPNVKHEAHELQVQCTFRVLQEAPDGINFGDLNYHVLPYGNLLRGPGTGRGISLTWPVDEGIDWDNDRIRLDMYKTAVANIARGVENSESAFGTEFCIRLLVTRFESYRYRFHFQLHNSVFDKSRRRELVATGIIKELPVKMFDASSLDIDHLVGLRFRRPITATTKLPDPWNPSCEGSKPSSHGRKGEWGDGVDQDWTTEFEMGMAFLRRCGFCCQRLKDQLESWKTSYPAHVVPVLFTSTGSCVVEFQFIDPEDGVSEWTYRLMHRFSVVGV